ncbi:MAG: alpha/beta hydrolase [Thiohalomonadales bacterium]
MSDSTIQQNPMFTTEVVYQLPFNGKILTDLPFSTNETLVMDIYYPSASQSTNKILLPVVLFVTGYSDTGFQTKIGMKLKEVKQYSSWARLIAASGIIAVTYSNTDPEQDIVTLIHYLKENGKSLGINANKIAVWSCSGNVPNALSVLILTQSIQCAALCYGYMLDFDGATEVAKASESFQFVNPDNGNSPFPNRVPILVVRAGKDECPGLNTSIDKFVQHALQINAAISLINHPDGNHAFDLFDNSEQSIKIIENILAFFQFNLE